MLAIRSHASALAMVASKSLATTATAEPGEGALNHPSFRLGLEATEALRPGDEFDCPLARIGERVEQLLSAVDPIGEDVTQLGKALSKRSEQWHSAMKDENRAD